MRQIGKILAVAIFVSAALTSVVKAELRWYVAEVIAAGIAPTNNVALQISDTSSSPVFTDDWFRANLAVKKEMLATALTAISANLTVWVYTDVSAPGSSEIFGLYLRNRPISKEVAFSQIR